MTVVVIRTMTLCAVMGGVSQKDEWRPAFLQNLLGQLESHHEPNGGEGGACVLRDVVRINLLP